MPARQTQLPNSGTDDGEDVSSELALLRALVLGDDSDSTTEPHATARSAAGPSAATSSAAGPSSVARGRKRSHPATSPPSDPNSSTDAAADPNSSGDDAADADALYDAGADSEDEQWVRRHLMRRPDGSGGGGDGRVQLSCPSCFALLCVQCQAHERHEGQFRAIFVRNCVTRSGETMRVRVTREGRRGAEIAAAGEMLRPVACAKCDTEVAVRDTMDVYHFCNVAY